MKKKGFTIVELVVVIAVIAVLAAVLIPTFATLIKKANRSADTQNLRNMNTLLAIEKAESGEVSLSDAIKAVYNGGYDLMTKDADHRYAFNKTKCEFEYVENTASLGADYETMTEVTTLDSLETSVENGGIVYLKGSYDLNDSTEKKYLHVKSDLVVVGDSSNLTVPNDAKDTSGIAFWGDQTSPLFVVENNDVTITLCGLNLNGTSSSNSLVATAANNTTINLFDCTLNDSNYAVNIRNYGDKANNALTANNTLTEDATVNIYIKNCNINANLSAFNFKYVGGTVTVEDSVLSQKHTGDYALIANEGNGVKMTFKNCTLNAAGDDILSTQYGAKNTTVTFEGCTDNGKNYAIATSGSGHAGTGNKIIKDGTTYTEN